MKVLGVVGSKRKRGNTARLVKEALQVAANEGLDTELVYLGDYQIRGCTGCEGCKKTFRCVIQDGMQELYAKVEEADGLILGSPTYFYNMTSDMKAFIERLYCYEVFDESDRSIWMSVNEAMGGKLASTIAICEQHDEKDMGFTSEAMNLSLESLGYRIVDSEKILDLYKAEAAKKSEEAIMQASRAGERLAKTLLLRENIRKAIKKAANED